VKASTEGRCEVTQNETIWELSQFSAESISLLQGRRLVLYRDGEEQQPVFGWRGSCDPGLPCVHFEASPERRVVSSIDSSVVVVGETDDGFVLAGKVAVVSSSGSGRSVLVYGPSICYIGESNFGAVQEMLNVRVPAGPVLRDAALVTRLLRVILERFAALEAAQNLSGGILELDGSLKTSSFEPKKATLSSIIQLCSDSGTYLLGVTKNTKLRQLQRLGSCLYERKAPSYLDVTDTVRLFVPTFRGTSLLVRLSNDGIVLRIDMPTGQASSLVDALGCILSSDIISHGYPDSLRSAHLLSIFSQVEVACAKGSLVRTKGTQILSGFNVREKILGRLEVGRRN
jgi:hypothetical protein